MNYQQLFQSLNIKMDDPVAMWLVHLCQANEEHFSSMAFAILTGIKCHKATTRGLNPVVSSWSQIMQKIVPGKT